MKYPSRYVIYKDIVIEPGAATGERVVEQLWTEVACRYDEQPYCPSLIKAFNKLTGKVSMQNS